MSPLLSRLVALFRFCSLLLTCTLLLQTAQGELLWEALKSGQALKMPPDEVKKKYVPEGMAVNAFAGDRKDGVFHVVIPTVELERDSPVFHVLWTWKGDLSEDEWKKIWYDDAPVPDKANLQLQLIWAIYDSLPTEICQELVELRNSTAQKNSTYSLQIETSSYHYNICGEIRKDTNRLFTADKKSIYLNKAFPSLNFIKVRSILYNEPCPLTEALTGGKIWKVSEQRVRRGLMYGGQVESSQAEGENKHTLHTKGLRLFSRHFFYTIPQLDWHWEGTGEQQRLQSLTARLLRVDASQGWSENQFLSEADRIRGTLEAILQLKSNRGNKGVYRYISKTYEMELRTELSYAEGAVGENKKLREGKLLLTITPKGGARPQQSEPSPAPAANAEQSPLVKAVVSGELWNMNAAAVREKLLRGSYAHTYADVQRGRRIVLTGKHKLQSGKETNNEFEAEAQLHNAKWHWRGANGNAKEWRDFWQWGAKNDCAGMRPLWLEGELYHTPANKAAAFNIIENNRLTLLRSIFGSNGTRSEKAAGGKQLRIWRWESPQYVAEMRSTRQFSGSDKAQLVDSSITLILTADAAGMLRYNEQKSALDKIFRHNHNLADLLQSGELWSLCAAAAREGLVSGMLKDAYTDKQKQRVLLTEDYTIAGSGEDALKISDLQWGWQSTKGNDEEWKTFWKRGYENECGEMNPLWLQGDLRANPAGKLWREDEFNAQANTYLNLLKQTLGSKPKRINKNKTQDNGGYTVWRWEKAQFVAELHATYTYADSAKAASKDRTLKRTRLRLIIAADDAALPQVN